MTILGEKCKQIRRDILQASFDAGACHLGSSLSCVEILVALYYDILKKEDVFLFSKASGVATFYSILKDKGIVKEEVSDLLKKYPLPSREVSGVVWSGGSLGHGLSVAVGMALADRKRKVYCLLSDGELQEGSTWEAVLFAGHHKLNNLTVIVDYNQLQACGEINDILKLNPVSDKFKAFNWNPIVVNGHDIIDIKWTINNWQSEEPKVIIANTIKGQGVKFMENKYEWHYQNLDKQGLEEALLQQSS